MRSWGFFILSFYLLQGCSVLSLLNSGTVHVKYTISEATFNGVKYDKKTRLGDPSVSIRNVQHPRSFGNWNLNLKLTPSLHYDDTVYQTNVIRTNTLTGDVDNYPNIKIKRGILMGNTKLTAHTPVGAFSLSLGIGGTIYSMDDGPGSNATKARSIRKVDLAYTAFLSRRLFFLMGPRYYKASYETFVFAFRLGYYWGSTYSK